MAAIVSAEMSRFGRREDNVLQLAAESALPIARRFSDIIDFAIISNCYSGELADVSGVNDLLTTYLSMDTVPSFRVDNTSASGGASLMAACSLIDSGMKKSVLLTGVEKMSGKPTREVARTIASLLPPKEREAGPSLPSLAGLLTKLYLKEYQEARRESIAKVSVKNHKNGAMNQYSHIKKEVTLEEVLESRVIADPLRLYEFCPVSDGSASLFMVPDDEAESYSKKPVYIKGIGFGSDTSFLTDRKDLLHLDAVRRAGKEAMERAGVTRPDFAELHDMSSILEIVESEALGLFGRGEGHIAVENGVTGIGGELPINTSGGLISRGHPIGATGIAQIYEAYLQITDKAGSRQVKSASVGMTLGMAGFGNSAVATILGESR